MSNSPKPINEETSIDAPSNNAVVTVVIVAKNL